MARPLKQSALCGLVLAVSTAGLCLASTGLAQNTTPRPRITAAIDNTQRVALAGTHPHQALAADDAGAVPPNTQLHGMSLAFSRTIAQQVSLDQLAAAQQNPSSPVYHRWLTPAQFAAQYGAADADIAALKTWLESQGFSVDAVSHSRGRISFSGSAISVANAFGAKLHYYKAASETTRHYAPSTDVSIPAALAPAILTIGNLSNYRPLPQIIVRAPRPVSQDASTAVRASVYLTPSTVAGIYDAQSVYNSGLDGTGQTIAIVGQSAVLPLDLANFQTANGLPVKPQSLNLIPDTGAATVVDGDELESDLDLEYSSAMAPGASVAFYYTGPDGGGVYQALEYVIDNNLAQIISVSYATCEMPGYGSYFQSLDAVLEQGAVQGQTVVVASGDNGSTACHAFMVQPAVGDSPLVDYPASSPWVVALGGTEFPAADVTTDPINQTYWAPPTGDSAQATPLGYIPETVWNDAQGFWASGGGASIYEPLPLWQAGVPGIPEGTYRLVPDISLAASPMYPGYEIFSTNSEGNSSPLQIGGTSAAAPVFAGLLAVLNQAKGYTGGQGLINPTLYLLASNPSTYASAFHDITVGDNACTNVACDVGIQNTVYPAGVGYDEASGLGSIDFANLVAAWPQATSNSAVTTTTALIASSANATYGSMVTLTATVSNGNGGEVTMSSDGVAVGYALVSSLGVATLSLSTLPTGSDSITAAYLGTTGYTPSTSTAVLVTVAPAPSTTVITESATTGTYGSNLYVTATVTYNGVPVPGNTCVNFYWNGTYEGCEVTTNAGVATFGVRPSVGTTSITAHYSGTPEIAPSDGGSVTYIATLDPTTTVVTASSANPTYGSSVTLSSSTTSAENIGGTFNGYITFYNGQTAIGGGNANVSGVVTISLSTLPVGTNSITAKHPGNSYVAPSTSAPMMVNVAPDPTTTILSSTAAAAAFGSSITLSATVTSGGIPVPSGGAITFLNGGVSIGTGTANDAGTASITLSTLTVGTDAITSMYAGTATLAASASAPIQVTVTKDPTTTVVSTSTTNITYGSSASFTATVSDGGAPAPSGGVVTFLNGGISIGTGMVNNNGAASMTLSTLSVGADSITASYAGTATLAASASAPVQVTVAAEPTATVLSVSSTNVPYGSTVSFTATVTIDGVSLTTGGYVAFSNGVTTLGTAAMNGNGVATLNLSTLPVGSSSITASFAGTTTLAASASGPVPVTVTPNSTTTQLAASTTNTTYGSSVTLSATVTSGGAPATTGEITILRGGVAISTSIPNSSGVVSTTLSTLPIGTNTITASYAGPSTMAPSTATPITVTVTQAATTTVILASPTSPAFGSNVTISATVTSGGAPVTTGVVTFLNGGISIGTGTVNGSGAASMTLSTLPVGADSIIASYAGTTNLAASASAPVIVNVAQPPAASTTTVVAASSTAPAYGTSVTLTATVTSGGSPVASGGSVTFLNDGVFLGTETVNSSGAASMILSTLPVGVDSITASYGGSAIMAASVSAPITVTVADAPILSAPAITVPAPPAVTAGNAAAAAVSVTAGSGYSGTMNLTCTLTGSPVGAQYLPTCSLNPATITVAANGIAASTLTVQTTFVTTTAVAHPSGWTPWNLGETSTMAALLPFLIPGRRRRMASLLALLFVVLSMGAVGCGAGTQSAPIAGTKSTTAGSYSFTVKGTDASNSSTTASSTVTITVE